MTQKIVIDGALLHPAKGKADVIAVTNEFMGDSQIEVYFEI